MPYARASIVRHGRCEDGFIFAAAFHPVDTLRFLAGEIDRWSVRTHGNGRGRAMDVRPTLACVCGLQA